MTRFSITMVAALGMLLGTVPVARAADFSCTGSISNTTIYSNLAVPAGATCTLVANVTVTGNVVVEAGASFFITPPSPPAGSPVNIGGNIVARTTPGCFQVAISASSSEPVTIGGNVAIYNCTSTDNSRGNGYIGPNVNISGSFTCTGNDVCAAESGSVGTNLNVNNNSGAFGSSGVLNNKIGGNVEVNGNGPNTGVIDNVISGNVQLNDNGGASAAAGNTISANLTCTGNGPGFVGSPNMVAGKTLPKSGSQC